MILLWIYLGITALIVFLIWLLYDNSRIIPTFIISLGWPIYFILAIVSEVRDRMNKRTDKRAEKEIKKRIVY